MVPAIATPGRSGRWDKLVGSCPQITPASPFLAFVPLCKLYLFRHPLSPAGGKAASVGVSQWGNLSNRSCRPHPPAVSGFPSTAALAVVQSARSQR